MKISILIVAHNEEGNIAECIESVLNQTKKADEIVLVVHNSTDKTVEIVRKYPIKVLPFWGEVGPVYARIFGLQNVGGDIVLCLDGDSVAERNWAEVMCRMLEKGNILVGSYVKFKGTLYSALTNPWNKYFCRTKGTGATRWVWASSMGFFGKDREKIIEILKNSIRVAKELSLSRIAEDYQLALVMQKEGGIEVTNKTFVTAHEKEKSFRKAHKRNRENLKNGEKIRKYFVTRNI